MRKSTIAWDPILRTIELLTWAPRYLESVCEPKIHFDPFPSLPQLLLHAPSIRAQISKCNWSRRRGRDLMLPKELSKRYQLAMPVSQRKSYSFGHHKKWLDTGILRRRQYRNLECYRRIRSLRGSGSGIFGYSCGGTLPPLSANVASPGSTQKPSWP